MSDNHKPFSEQINVLMDEYGTGKLSEITGISDTMLRKWRAGTSLPGLDKLMALSRATGKSVQWLATGDVEQKESSVFAKNFWGEQHCDEFAMIPLYDVEASMGHGALNDQEHILNQLAFRKDWLKEEGLDAGQLAAIAARGDSMEPTIKSGDTLLIDVSDWFPDDGVYALRMSGKLYVKRIQRISNDVIRVKSDNPLYDDVDLSLGSFLESEDENEHALIGRVVWSGRRL